jgi:hypothetical protein
MEARMMVQAIENLPERVTQMAKPKSQKARLVARIARLTRQAGLTYDLRSSAGTRKIISRDKGDYPASYEENSPQRSPIREDKP